MYRVASGAMSSLLSATLLLAAAPAAATPPGPATPAAAAAPKRATAPIAITYAEQPLRLLRDTTLFTASRGVHLAPDDLIETGTGNVQLDVGGATVALGPSSRLLLRDGELVLLNGWMKLRASAAGNALTVTTAAARFAGTGAGILVVRAAPGLVEVFAETGELAVTELAGSKAQRQFKLPAEQFGARTGAAPFKLLARPPAAFLAAMPPVFLDAMVALSLKGPPTPPKPDRAAVFTDVAPWVAEQPALRQMLQRRFQPPQSPQSPPPPTAQAPANAPPQRVSDVF